MNYLSINLRRFCCVFSLLLLPILSFRTAAQITGINNVCVSSITPFTDATPGGTWSMSNTRATIDPAGAVTAITPGLDTILYNVSGVISIKPILIHPLPAPITGPSMICFGTTITLTDPTTGGSWSSSSPAIAPVGSATGVVSGTSAGSAVVSYTLSATGCYVTVPVTVNIPPSQFIGCDNVGVGDSLSFYGIGTSNLLTTSDPAIAVYDTASGKIIGVAPGAAQVYLNDPVTGCVAEYRNITVTTTPMITPILGNNILCAGNTAIQIDSTSGGTWSSGDGAIASISSSGFVTAVSGGVTVISYMASGFTCNEPFAVNSLPAPISGASAVCINDTIVLSSSNGAYRFGTFIDTSLLNYYGTLTYNSYIPPAGGTFTSSDSSVANIISEIMPGTGYIQGIAPGTGIITYADNYTGCAVSLPVSVNPLPSLITGLSYFHCPGGGTTLYNDSVPGGTWSTSNPAIAAIGASTGLLTAFSLGAINISYTLPTGCLTTLSVTNVLPSTPISGANPICPASYDTLSWFPGSAWISGNPSIATIDPTSGYLTGISSGVAVINATMGTGCSAARFVTINPVPAAISGSSVVCVGDAVTLLSSGAGTWSSLSPTIASAGSLSGIVSGLSAGVSPIVFTNSFGCTVSMIVTVGLSPVAAPLSGPGTVCQGSVISLSDTSSGGIYSTSSTAITSVSSTGDVTGVSAGVATIYYTVSTICASAIASQTVTVNPLPVAGTLTGASTVCPGATITLSDVDTGGVWAISNGNALGSAGLITGVTAGMDTISYAISNICGTASASKTITINALPAVGPISGSSTVCVASAITLTDGLPGGTWSTTSFNASVSGGVTTGLYAGTADIVYTSTTPCGSTYSTKTITINPLPNAGTIVGSTHVCTGATVALTDPTTGGIWNSSNARATVSAAGLLTGVTIGEDTIGYSVTNSCGTAMASEIINVDPLPMPYSLTGGGSYCAGGAGVAIGLYSSEVWLNYLVYKDSISTGFSMTGTGAALDFGLFPEGKYIILATNTTTGCENYMTGFDTIYIAPPVIPTITITAHPGQHIGVGLYDTLTAITTGAGTAPSYQWYSNGMAIYGATSSTYISDVLFYDDSFSCVVNSSAECGTSAVNHIIVTTSDVGVTNVGVVDSLQVYPNPSKGTFTFNCNSNTNEDVQIIINNITGEKVQEVSTSTNKHTLIKLDAPPGIYFITATTSTGSYITKISIE